MRPLLCLIALLAVLTVQAQQKKLQATKIFTAPRIDGALDEPCWQSLPEATDFVTNTPVYGQPASVKTVVKLAYDNDAIYIGAYLYDDPKLIRKQFTTRDNQNRADVDYFGIFLDTYNDHQNAFHFLVTSRNVQTDSRMSPTASNGFGTYGDQSWDAVWDSKIQMQKDGWTVEMRIPHFSIRFAQRSLQNWGINFLRFTRRNNETTFWNPIDPNINGFVNQFGDLDSLQDLAPPVRLSFSPYISGGYRNTPELRAGRQTEWLKSGGLDVKYGLNESFTLDATLIPDFGQVISDNVVNNITPFEQQFRENRPFFTEGTELFNKAGTFYSRRIGKTPAGYYDVKGLTDTSSVYELVKNPSVTRLYNALKFSGRNKHNLGIGIFNAVTESVHATVANRQTGQDSSILTEGLANYNIIVLDQALKNRSYLTFTNTNVMRDGHANDANVTALDIALYNPSNTYAFSLKPRYSRVFGRNGYDGFKNTTEFGKISGKWQWNVNNDIESDKYDPNDLGFIFSPNEVTTTGSISYNLFTATKNFLNQRYAFTAQQSYLYKPFGYQKTEFIPSVFFIFKNFWDITVRAPFQPFWYNDYFELQTTGRKLRRSSYYSLFVEGSSDSRKKLYISWSLGGAEGPLSHDPFHYIELGARYRFNDRFTLEANVTEQHDQGQWGLANNGSRFIFDGSGEPVLARRKYTDMTTVISGVYNFTSRMNLTFRARHYWNKLENTNLYFTKTDGNWQERFDLDPKDYNANYNIFNLDVFYTWDFRLGSRIVLGYKNWLGNDYLNSVNTSDNPHYGRNLRQVFNRPHGNELTLRFIYFLNYTDLRQRQRR